MGEVDGSLFGRALTLRKVAFALLSDKAGASVTLEPGQPAGAGKLGEMMMTDPAGPGFPPPSHGRSLKKATRNRRSRQGLPMRIHRTTTQDVWNRVKVARRVLRERPHRPRDRNPGRHKARVRAKAYFAKMRGMPGKDIEIFPVEIMWSFIGSLAGMAVLTLVNTEALGRADNILLMGTFGASAMLLFGAPQVPFAQPRNVIGGHVVSALVGITAYTLCGESSIIAPALGVAGAIAAMHATGTLHPPGGGTALMMATGDQSVIQYGYLAVFYPVATATAILVAVALITNNLARDRRYPVSWW